MGSPINPHKIYEAFDSHKLLLSTDLEEGMTDDAMGIYQKARSEIEEALMQTESGTKVYHILNQALGDMPKDPQTDAEIMDNYNKALEDLGPLS